VILSGGGVLVSWDADGFPRAVPDNWYQMDACLRGPDLTQQDAQISSMLTSVRTAEGD
jgi:hypothetical protein